MGKFLIRRFDRTFRECKGNDNEHVIIMIMISELFFWAGQIRGTWVFLPWVHIMPFLHWQPQSPQRSPRECIPKDSAKVKWVGEPL